AASVLERAHCLATVMRHSSLQEPFDNSRFLGDVAENLLGVRGVRDRQPVPLAHMDVNVHQEVRSANTVIGVALVASATSDLLALVTQRIRQTQPWQRVLIVVDAIDQAEDEGTNEFLRSLATIQNVAAGTG